MNGGPAPGPARARRSTAPVAHVAALDGLRGVAVVAVVAFHRGWLPGGWLGVDAFFTLSGFLITSLLLREAAATGGIDLRAFWRRRVRRLQPAALLAVLAIVATAPWWAAPGTGPSVWRAALAALGSVANWQALWAHRPYAAGTSPSAFEHFWSLAIEEQFYVVWPLVVAGLVAWRRRAWVLPVAVAGTALSWAALAIHGLQRGYLGTDGRVGSILLGAVLAFLSPLGRHHRPSGDKKVGVVGVVALAAMAGLWVVGGWPPRAPLAVLIPVHALLTAVVLLRPPRLLEWRPLAGLGRVSYGVYLWHWPVLVVLTPERLGLGVVATDVVRLAVTAACTAASWRLIEHPVRTGRLVRRTRPAWAMAAAVVLLGAAVGSHAVGPAPAWAKAGGELVTSAAPGTAGPHRVLVVGDSVPTSLMAGDAVASWQVGDDHLLGALAAHGLPAAGATVTSCPVVDEVVILKGQGPNEGCPAILARILPAAFAGFGPDVVLWYSRQDAYEIRTPDGRVEDPIASPAAARRLRQRYADRLRWFAEHGARVILVSPGPNADGHNGNDERGDSARSMAFLDAQLRRVAAEHPDTVLGVIAMRDFTARDPDARGDDGLHFADAGAARASEWLARRVAQLLGVEVVNPATTPTARGKR